MHRTSPKPRSLSVQRETLRVLASSEMQQVGGGVMAVGEAYFSTGANRYGCVALPQVLEPTGGGTGPSGMGGGCTETGISVEIPRDFTREIFRP